MNFQLFCVTRYLKTPQELKLFISEFVSAVIMEGRVLWVVTPCSLVDIFSTYFRYQFKTNLCQVAWHYIVVGSTIRITELFFMYTLT